MGTKKTAAIGRTKHSDDSDALFEAEWDEPTRPSHVANLESLDAELPSSGLHLTFGDTQMPGDVLGVDTGGHVLPVVHNSFFVEGKVPSLNELLDAKGGSQPRVRSIIMRRLGKDSKGRGARTDLYNDLKQDWKARTVRALPATYNKVESCYFGYVIVEENEKRDPSNICSAAVKFIEDGLVKAGVIGNDGWKQVLGIRVQWLCRRGRIPGIFVVMASGPIAEEGLTKLYEDWFRSGLVLETAYGPR